MLQNSTAVSYGARAPTRLASGLAGATLIFGSYSWTPTTVSQSRGILYHPSVCIRLSKHIVNKLLILSNSRDILSHPSTRPLFGGFHCFGYSSDKRLWLPPSDKRLWPATPRWWSFLLQIHPHSRMGHAHQLGLQAVWPVLRRYSAPIPGRLLLSANRAEFCPILPCVYGCLSTLSINS